MNELKPNEVRSEQSGLLSSALFGVFLFPSDGGPPGQEAEDRGAGGGSALVALRRLRFSTAVHGNFSAILAKYSELAFLDFAGYS